MANRPKIPPGWLSLIPNPALKLATGRRPRRVLEGRLRPVGLLFVDIEGCTRLCEDLPPQEMNLLIETYFSAYLDIVRHHGGEVLEVLGDGLLALFDRGDLPANTRSAFLAALRICAKTVELNQRAKRRDDAIVVNIGLNAGTARVGFTRLRGRSGERWVFSANGPVTNVAARLSALATGGSILTTKAVADLLPSGTAWRSLGPKLLKNVTGPLEVIEIATVASSRPKGKSESDRPTIEPPAESLR